MKVEMRADEVDVLWVSSFTPSILQHHFHLLAPRVKSIPDMKDIEGDLDSRESRKMT